MAPDKPVHVVGDDAIDDLFDYDVDMDDAFREVDTDMNVPKRSALSPKATEKMNGSGLGIEEEIKLTRQRNPVVKLDEGRSVA